MIGERITASEAIGEIERNNIEEASSCISDITARQKQRDFPLKVFNE